MGARAQRLGNWLGTGMFALVPWEGVASEVSVDYLSAVKPVLKERCYACHGALKQKAGLRLDTAEAIRRGSENGPVVDLAQPEASEILRRLEHDKAEERMPPEGKPVRPETVAEIRKWIAAGVPAVPGEEGDDDPEEHWAFQKIVRPPLPKSEHGNPIDAFLAAKRAEKGLVAVGEGPRSLLVRRLYLDLIGLPPSRAQLHDPRPWNGIVDALLESPQHGERWARHWMDVWRYSDGYGLNKQLRRSQKHMWHWRDWIVESLNADKGYHRMIHEMLAGDEFAPEDMDVVRATGFLARNYYLFNRTTWLDSTIEHTSKAFLGLTVNCAKCHDHKYDPILMEDYYRLRAIFEPHQVRLDEVPGEPDLDVDGIPRVFDNHLDAETHIHRRGDPKDPDTSRRIEPGVPKIFADFQEEIAPVQLPVVAWAPGTRPHVLEQRLAAAKSGWKKAREDLVRAQEAEKKHPVSEPRPEDYLIADTFDHLDESVWEVGGEGWEVRDGKLHKIEADRSNVVVRTRQPHPRDFEASCRYTVSGGTTFKSVGIRFDRIDDGANQNQVYTSAHKPDPKVQVSHKVNGKDHYPPKGKVSKPIAVGESYALKIAVRDRLLNVWLNDEFVLAYELPRRHENGRIAISGFDAVVEFDAFRLRALPEEFPLRTPKDGPAPLTSKEAGKAMAEAEAKLERVETMIRNGRDRSSHAKEEFEAFNASRKALETPEHKFEQYPATWPRSSTGRRMMLARWMTHPGNPLTARVAVNHVWLRHFGKPLVETVSDFGRRAPRPDHLALLDFLAAEFMDSGWSFRRLHRLIVTSEAYRMASSSLAADGATRRKDPDNRWYWRMPARRMEAEVVRDSLLALAGELDPAMGGPSVDPKSGGVRRSLYFKHSRDDKDAFLSMFDHADHLRCYRRSESVRPQQALALSNSGLALEASGKIAARLSEPETDRRGFVAGCFEALLGRAPSTEEREACLEFLDQRQGDETLARTRLVHALLNHNDFITIR